MLCARETRRPPGPILNRAVASYQPPFDRIYLVLTTYAIRIDYNNNLMQYLPT
jgi:hypothetical protein